MLYETSDRFRIDTMSRQSRSMYFKLPQYLLRIICERPLNFESLTEWHQVKFAKEKFNKIIIS